MKSGLKPDIVCNSWLLLLLSLAVPARAIAGEVRLQWDPNSETDLAGHRIYWGAASGQYGIPITAGLQTTYTVTNLAAGNYYFAVTAVNSAGVESGFSNEVFGTVAGTTVTSCDQNSDGLVNALDLQVLSNVILQSQSCQRTCDLNRDGRIDALDFQLLADIILGARTCP